MILKNRFKKFMALSTMVAVTTTAVPVVKANDYEGHWAASAISKWVELGILEGYEEGSFKPKQAVTRAELGVILSRVFGLSYQKDAKTYEDVKASSWYAEAIGTVSAAGLMNDFGASFKPEQAATREEAAYAIARAYHLSGKGSLNFTDQSQISSWAEEEVIALVTNGFLHGRPDGSLAPHETLTRADLVVMLDKITGQLIQNPGSYTGVESGNLVVSTSEVILENMKIVGNLYLTEGIGEGDITLKNVEVTGKVIIEGGGEHSIHLEQTQLAQVEIKKAEGKVRLVGDSSSRLENVKVESALNLEVATKYLEVETTQAISLKTMVEEVVIAAKGAQLELKETAQVQKLVANQQATLKGSGQIKEAIIEAEEVVMEGLKIENITVAENIQKLPTINKPVSSGGGGGGSSHSSNSEMSLNLKTAEIEVDESLQLKVSPTTAKLNWTSSDETIATVDQNGKVTGKAKGTVIIEVSRLNGKEVAQCIVTVKEKGELIKPEVPSEPNEPIEPESPSVPEKPEQPNLPEGPSVPEKPEQPNLPAEPVKPDVPVVPGTPQEPVEPDAPSGPVISCVTIKGESKVTTGSSIQLSAEVTTNSEEASNQAVNWSLKQAPEGCFMSSKGLFTAGPVAGTAIVVATSQKDAAQFAQHFLTILNKEAPVIPVQGVSLNQTSAQLKAGETMVLKATVAPYNATNKNLSWHSSDHKVLSVDQNGRLTAHAEGNAVVTVTTLDGEWTASCEVKVTSLAIEGNLVADELETAEVRLYQKEANGNLKLIKKLTTKGAYRFNNLPEGSYELEIIGEGLKADYYKRVPALSLEAQSLVRDINLEAVTSITWKLENPVVLESEALKVAGDYDWQQVIYLNKGNEVKLIAKQMMPELMLQYELDKKGYHVLSGKQLIKPNERNTIKVQLEPVSNPVYPENLSLYKASLGENTKGVGDTTYEVLKAAGWRRESTTKLSLHSGMMQFENLEGQNGLDAKVTLKCAPEETDRDALYLLSLMIGPESSLSFEKLVELIGNGSSTIQDGTRTIGIKYNGQISYTLEILFTNF